MKKTALFLALLVSVSLLGAEFTATQTAKQIGAANGWRTGNFYDSFVLDGVVTIAAHQPDSGSLNGYFSPDTPRDWRMYQARNNGEFSISVPTGLTIRSVILTYSTTRTGVLSLIPGTNVDSAYQVPSDSELFVNASSITLYAANLTSTTNGQVRLSAFSIIYGDSTSVVETFANVIQAASADEGTIWQGDLAEWQVKRVRRATKDTLNNGVQGTWSKYGGYMRTTNAEGGVKRIHFAWRQFVTAETSLTLAMAIGDTWKDTATIQSIASQAESRDNSYAKEVLCKENAQLSFANITRNGEQDQDRFLIGNIFITPYLYIDPEYRSLRFDKSVGTFDMHSILLDNTDGEGDIVYTILSDETGSATISGSVVSFAQATTGGAIQVQVSWNNGKVTLSPVTLHIMHSEDDDTPFTETFSRCTKTQYTGTTYVVGDRDVFGWNMTHFAREASDTVMGEQGTRIGYSGGLAMNGAQEGGIKSISFYWRATKSTQPVTFTVSVDGEPYEQSYTAAQQMGISQKYTSAFNIPYNTAMSVTMGAKESTPQSEIIVGSIRIAPYMLFRTKQDTVRMSEANSYDLDSVLINNTDTAAVYTIVSDETGVAVLNDGVLDLSQVTATGKIRVQAVWGQVTTTMTVVAYTGATGLNQLSDSPVNRFTKVIKNGQLIIIRDNQAYNAQGSPLSPITYNL